MKIKLSKLEIYGGTQPRVDIDEDTVTDYADAMKEGDQFPPVVVFQDGLKYWLADGFHRVHASHRVGFKEIHAEVKTGTRRDAILYSVSANAKHGLRRTVADKQKAVQTLLKDQEWSQWSTREIARQCQVSVGMVSKYRNEMTVQDEQSNIRKGADGRTIDTSNIGSKKKLLDDPSDYEDKNDNGYDLPDNVDTETGEVFDDDSSETIKKERKGIGLRKAHEAIAKLKEIPLNDDLLQEGYDTVIQWINHNR